MLRQEKYQKKPAKGALKRLLPQSNTPPLETPVAHWTTAQHLRVAPVQAKSVPTFCLKWRYGIKSGGQGERSPCHRLARMACKFRSIRSTRLPSARRVRYIGEGGFLRGSAELSASPMPISLVTFLFGDKKVTLSTSEQNFQKKNPAMDFSTAG